MKIPRQPLYMALYMVVVFCLMLGLMLYALHHAGPPPEGK